MKQLLVLVAIALAGCTTILDADFEADTAGALPAEFPPGGPNDRLTISNDLTVTRVIDTAPLAGLLSLELNGRDEDEWEDDDPVRVAAHAEAYTDLSHPLFVSWQGRLSPGPSALLVTLFPDPFKPAIYVEFLGGQVLFNGTVSGSYTPGTAHAVEIRLIPNTDEFAATVRENDTVVATASGQVMAPEAFPAPELILTFDLFQAGMDDRYQVDDILIRHWQ